MKELKKFRSSKGLRGLMVKDFRFVWQNKTLLAVLLMIEAVFFTMQGSAGVSFVIVYMMMGCSVLVLSTITMDEHDKSMVFLMAMPVSRKDYVLEKYVLSFLSILTGCIVAVLPCFLLEPAGMEELLIRSAGIMAVMVLLQMVALPAQLKFGGERGRIVLVCICAVFVLLMVFAEKIGNRYLGQAGVQVFRERISDVIHRMNRAETGCIALVLCVVCFLISFRVSREIMEKKEF